MSRCVILNPVAGSAEETAGLERAISELEDTELLVTEGEGDALRFARDRAMTHDLVIAAGGDGTLHEVVNGLWNGGAERPRAAVGLVPLGTGNDFARTAAIPLDPPVALELALRGARRSIDLIHFDCAAETRVAINVCAGGFSGVLNEHLTADLKQTWGPLAYLLGAAAALPDLSGYEVEVGWEDNPPEPVDAINVVVANCRTAGGGKPAAPRANPEDGRLDVVIIRQATAAELGGLAARLIAGDYLDHELVLFRRASRVCVRSRPGMWFNADGELITNEPVTFTCLPGAVDVVVGPRYSPVPES
jgi:diacylglycerol kinase (ATP)